MVLVTPISFSISCPGQIHNNIAKRTDFEIVKEKIQGHADIRFDVDRYTDGRIDRHAQQYRQKNRFRESKK